MKKLLALVLALVMTLGLATVSSSAAYSDKADINYNEAVDVMTAVGVFQGKGSNFDPKANLNRAEAAKIVAYLMLGNDAAEAIKGTGSKFTDVPADHWASGYIEYLASAGVLSGVGGGKFDPNGQVTAIQLAKMLLVALGYDAEIEGFVGSDWAINIQKVANKVGIYDGNDAVVGNNPVTRDEAALYTFNTVKSPMVEYETTTTVNIGDANVKVGSNNWKYMTTGSSSSRYDNIDDAVTNDNNQAKIIEFGEQQWSNLVRDSSGDDGFGREKVVWTYKGTTVGEYTDKSDLIFTSNKKVEKGAMYDLFGSNDYDKLAAGKASVQLRVFWDGEKRDVDADGLSTYLAKNNTNASGMSGNGILTEVYRKDANENYRYGYYSDSYNYTVYTIVQVTTYVAQATANYNATREDVTIELLDTDNGTNNSITLGNGNKVYRDKDLRPANFATSISAKDFPVVKDAKEDDYLLVTWSKSDDEYGTVAVAEKRVGTVSQYKDTDYVYLDGEKLNYNATVGTNDENGKGVTYSINEKATVVLDAYGYIIYVDEALTTSSYVYVGKVADNSKLGKEFIGDAYFLDGTNKSIVIKKIDNTTVTNDNDLNGWYTFTVNSDKEYTLKTVKSTGNITTRYAVNANDYDAGKDTNEIVKNSTVKFMRNVKDANVSTASVFAQKGTTDATNIKANSNTEFIVYDKANDDTTAYKGIASVPDVTLNTNASAYADVKISYAMNSDNTYAKLVYIWMNKANADGTNDGSYTMLLTNGTNAVHKENTDYYEFDVVTDGALKEKTMVDTGNITLNKSSSASVTKGILLTKVKTNNDGYITSASEVGSSSDKEKKISLTDGKISQSGNTITLAGNSFVVTRDSKLNMVIGPDATDPKLLNKIGDDYNIYANTSIGAIAGMVKAYDHITDGVAYVVTTEKDNDKIDVLYVWINGVSKNAVAGSYALSWTNNDSNVSDIVVTADGAKVSNGAKVAVGAEVKVTAKVSNGRTLSVSGDKTTTTFTMPGKATALTISSIAGYPIIVKGDAKQEQGTVSNVRIVNGNLSAAVNYTVPEYVAAGKVFLSGKVTIGTVESDISTVFAGATPNGEIKISNANAAGGKGSFNLTTTGAGKGYTGSVPADANISFSDLALRFENITVKYYLVDTDHEIASSKMVDSISKLNTTDGTTTGGTATANVKAAISSTYYQVGTGETLASFSGVKAHATGSAAEVNATSSTKTWVQATTGQQLFTNDYIYATGTDYVKIVFKTQTETVTPLNVTLAKEVYDGTSAAALTATQTTTKDFEDFGLNATTYAGDKNTTLKFTATPASGSIAKNGLVTINVKSSVDLAAAYAYDVTLTYKVGETTGLNKTVTLTKGDANTNGASFTINGSDLSGDVVITGVSIAPKTELLRVTKATFDAAAKSVTLTFSEAVDASALAANNIIAGTIASGATKLSFVQGSSDKEIVIYFTGDGKTIATGDTVKVVSGVAMKDVAGNTINGAYTGLTTGIEITLGAADGSDFDPALTTGSVQNY